ncbi:tetratricopeptide (TPR) repeat protein [Variovorax boronicumulans]|uniref:tetratricopeptide repeat protein n=1 Tax=Variovorax boronicumulans TaxID=436515 RepID=UPI002786C5A0|nr:tetratricopeptide repeat protein [Variovorax boronicumulans]MDQ0015862.1 tetratricopeptide (TPR) repeat protein [Variovorax boronicumulans]
MRIPPPRSPRRKPLAWLLLVVGGFLGAHRFYLGSYLGGAAQLLLLLVGVSSLPGARFCLGLLGPWLLFDIYWVHVRLKRQDESDAARRPAAKTYDLEALSHADALRERFVAAAEMHDWARAVALSEQIVANARKVFKGPHQNLAMSLCMHGQACCQFKAFDEAKASLEESLAIGRQIGMPAEDMDIVRKALAMTVAAIGEHHAARQLRAGLPAGRGPGDDTVLLGLLEDQERRYKAAFERRDLALAERLCAEAVHTSRQLCGEGGLGKAVVLHLIHHAEFCRQLQWHDKAVSLLDECLAIIDQLGLDDSWRLGPSNTLALLHAGAGRSDEAEVLYKKTIAMAVALSKGNSTDEVVRAFNNLAFLYANTDQDEKAELCYARAMVHLDKLAPEETGEGDADLHADLLINFAQLHMARNEAEHAKPLFERALAIQERSCRGISTSAAAAHNDLGLIAQEQGDLREALKHFKRTLLLNQICAPDHFGNLANAQRNIDNVSLALAAVARAARLEPST